MEQNNTGRDVSIINYSFKCTYNKFDFYFLAKLSSVAVYDIKIRLEQHYPVYIELQI